MECCLGSSGCCGLITAHDAAYGFPSGFSVPVWVTIAGRATTPRDVFTPEEHDVPALGEPLHIVVTGVKGITIMMNDEWKTENMHWPAKL